MSTFEYLNLDRTEPTLVRAITLAEAAKAMVSGLPLLIAHAEYEPAKTRALRWRGLLRWLLRPDGERPPDVVYFHAAKSKAVWEQELLALSQQSTIFLSSMHLPRALDDHRQVFERWARMLDERVQHVEVAEASLWVGLVDQVLGPDAAAFQHAIERRDQLLASERWLTSEDIAGAARDALVESSANQLASQLRRKGQIIGARHQRKRIYPAAQFAVVEGRFQPLQVMDRLLELLPTDESGWSQIFWLFQPTRRLNGARPADVLATHSDDVLLAAKKEFCGDDGI